jgi:hypothetical protein
MATSRVTLRLIKRKKPSLYQLDYSVDGRRIRRTAGAGGEAQSVSRPQVLDVVNRWLYRVGLLFASRLIAVIGRS